MKDLKTRITRELGDKVYLDGDETLKGTITGVGIFAENIKYLVSWVINGTLSENWIESWRLRGVK